MADRVLMAGNEACGEGAIRAGCRAYYGYPITPQNELTAYMADKMVDLGRVFIQAESELAAISMVFGSSAAGARAMTSSSSPGISLKQEGISYMAGCELPGVIVNVQRGGPGLGNISGSQGDYFQATKGGGHGDYHCIVLAPDSVQEMFDLTYLAFDLADEYRNPVLILSDGVIGQMMEPITLDKPMLESGPKKDWALDGCESRPARLIRSLLLKDGALEAFNIHLQEKYKQARAKETRWEAMGVEGAEVILVAYGTSARICKEVRRRLEGQKPRIGMIRPISVFPFPSDVIRKAAEAGSKFLVVEMNSGQMVEDVRLAVEGRSQVEFYGRMGGSLPDEEEIIEKIRQLAAN